MCTNGVNDSNVGRRRIQGDDKAGSWAQAGHDAVYTTHTSRSSNPEWCVHPQRGVVTGEHSCTLSYNPAAASSVPPKLIRAEDSGYKAVRCPSVTPAQ